MARLCRTTKSLVSSSIIQELWGDDGHEVSPLTQVVNERHDIPKLPDQIRSSVDVGSFEQKVQPKTLDAPKFLIKLNSNKQKNSCYTYNNNHNNHNNKQQMQRFTRFIVSTINRSHHIRRRNATLALSQQEMSTHNRCFSRSLLRHQFRHNATTSKLNNNKNIVIINHSPSNCTLSNHQRVTFHTTRFTNNNNNNNNNNNSSSDQNHQQQQKLNSSILYESNSSSPILIAQQAYVRHRNIIWLVGANAALLYLPIVAPALKIITVLSSIVFGYFSKQNNRNHVPTILKSISIDSSDDSRFLLDRFDGRKTSVPIRDVIMDHEPLFKVYMPFGSFFWRSFLLNKSDMRSANELRFMVVKLGDSMREDTRNLSFNHEGEVVRTVYTVRADDETLDELRERLEQVRSHHDPPSQF